MNGPPSNPMEEWMKLVDAAERRKIQNRKAQRKYRKLTSIIAALNKKAPHISRPAGDEMLTIF